MARDFSRSFYKSKEWKQTRDYILKRDNYLCVKCNNPAEEVHHKIHLNPANIDDPRVTMNPDNLISLCKSCHFEAHRGEHSTGRKKEEEYPYEFNEYGELVQKHRPLGV